MAPPAFVLGLVQAASSPSNGPVPIQLVLVPLGAALALSLFVERVIEVLKNIVDMLPTTAMGRSLDKAAIVDDDQYKLTKFLDAADAVKERDKKCEELAGRLVVNEQLLANASDVTEQTRIQAEIDGIKTQLADPKNAAEWHETHAPQTIIVEPATDPDDGTTLRTFVVQTLALVTGILAARFTSLRLFHVLTPGTLLPASVDYLLTGLFIGGGSAPAHMVIRFITERKITVPTVPQRAEAPTTPALVASESALPAVQLTPTRSTIAVKAYAGSPATDPDALDIPYAGGVDRDKLESIHRRGGDPNLVVFHHTAMPLTSSFEDLVRVIKDRTDDKGNHWITGYNCVVTHDGVIHPFCRWDRYGNHAQGYNRLSLGVSLNGNFETSPSVPYSNPDGRYGPSRPTEAQLDGAARVVALWTHLYPAIPLEFGKRTEGIIPHKNVSPKTCPGNMFPYEEFERLVRHYHAIWEQSPECRARIDAFRLRPFLYDGAIPKSRWVVIPVAPPTPALGFPAATAGTPLVQEHTAQ
jgi:N-acetylmuramoyl-L-alanine amidase-like protein